METYGLIAVEGDQITTAFPVVVPTLLTELLRSVKALAALNELAQSPRASQMLAAPSGQKAVPVVRAHRADRIHGPSLRIAKTFADTFRPGGAAQPLLDALPFADRKERVLIVAHELI